MVFDALWVAAITIALSCLMVQMALRPVREETFAEDELVLTQHVTKPGVRKDMYGYVDLGSMDLYMTRPFTLECEVLLDEPAGHSFHALFWLSLFGDPTKESSSSSKMNDDGGMRVFLSKLESFSQAPHLDAFRTTIGVARAGERPWDLTQPAYYVPKSQWFSLNMRVDLVRRTVRIYLDEDTFDFVIPTSFEIPKKTVGGRLYIGAKTLLGSGVRIRNMRILRED